MAYTTIDNPGLFFNTITYSGNGSNPRTLTGVGFQPDWVWQKNRTDSNGHTLADAVRGANKTLSSDGSGAELTDKSDGHLDAFTSDGFTVGAGSGGDARVNDGSNTYVAWNWLAGNGTASNGDGATASTVSVNSTAGFSIVSWTGTGSGTTIGHGLGAVPKLIITKCLTTTHNWGVYHHSLGVDKYLRLNTTDSEQSSSGAWGSTPTSSVFGVGGLNENDQASQDYIAYCFAEKVGYSKFGKFIGNGSTDGPFIYTGFKPAFVIAKESSSGGGHWRMRDNKRMTAGNPIDKLLRPDEATAEQTEDNVDFLSNGFKMRTTGGENNGSGDTYIYMAFGQSLVGSNNVPCTAR